VDATARAVIECAADAIVAFGAERAVLLWNPAAERMFGWRAAEVLGEEPPLIPEELMAEHNAALERVRSGGQISYITRRARKDGKLLDLRIDASALRDRSGEVIGWVNVCHRTGQDAAARHHMAERAQVVRKLGDVVADMNAQRDLEAVLDRIAASLCDLTGADAGGFVLIEEDRVRLVSVEGLPARLRGRTSDLPTSLVGQLMRSGRSVMMTTGDSGEFAELIWSALPGLHTIALALSHVGDRPYGALYALYSGRKVGHMELELLELLAGHAGVALTNATAFEELVRQRAHERAVIDASADGIAVLDGAGLILQWNPAAHKLTGMSAAEVTGKPPPFPVPEPGAPRVTHRLPTGRWLDVLCNELNGKDERVVDFRDVTAAKELEEAKDLVRNGPFDLAALLRGTVAAFLSLSDKHKLVADIPADLPPAHGDAMATDIMVGQLLENAFKYSPNGGTITVAARPAGDWIEVTVDDEGIGIAPGDHERIFERFVQGETGDRRRFGGIGLGLYIVRQLARAQDGEVAASSRPGGGTRMSLQLRRAGAAPEG